MHYIYVSNPFKDSTSTRCPMSVKNKMGDNKHLTVDRDIHKRIRVLSITNEIPVEKITNTFLASVLYDDLKCAALIKSLKNELTNQTP